MRLQEAQKILSDIQAEMTNLIFPMRQSVLENQVLGEALACYLSNWSNQYGILVKFTTEIQGQEKNYFLSAQVKGTFFRVAQEALSNVARHSKATCIQVTLAIDWLHVTLKIADNGQGFNAIKRKDRGMGLTSMQERMKELGGDLQINSGPRGTEVIAIYNAKDTVPNIAILSTLKKVNGAKKKILLPWKSPSKGTITG